MSVTVRAVLTNPDAPGAVELASRTRRDPSPGERVIRVRAFALNRGELRFATGKPAGTPIGWDIAGELEDGTRVVGFSAAQDGWAEEVVLPEEAFAPLPDGVGFEVACALPVAAGTALACVDAAGVGLVGRRVLVTGVTGGVGGFAVRLARLAGAEVVAQVRKPEQVPYAEGLGADEVVVTADGAAFADLAPVRAFIDGVGGALFTSGLPALERDGVAINYGVTGDAQVALPLGVMLGKGRARIRGLNLYAVSEKEPPAEWLPRLLRLVADGRLEVDHTVLGDWSAVGQAAEDLVERRFTGKGVLTVG
jgi:NADPH2:quinone reductase